MYSYVHVVLAMERWLSGWMSHASIMSKWLNLSKSFFDHLVAQPF